MRRLGFNAVAVGVTLLFVMTACADAGAEGPPSATEAEAMCETFARKHDLPQKVASSPLTALLATELVESIAPHASTKPWSDLPAAHPVATCSFIPPLPIPTFPENPTPGQTVPVTPPRTSSQYLIDGKGRASVLPKIKDPPPPPPTD